MYVYIAVFMSVAFQKGMWGGLSLYIFICFLKRWNATYKTIFCNKLFIWLISVFVCLLKEKLKEREREMRKRKEREEQEMERVRLKVRRKDAVVSYQALLVERIKDPQVVLFIIVEVHKENISLHFIL